ncbi:unnamed protein product, partial [Laminaria digitata]
SGLSVPFIHNPAYPRRTVTGIDVLELRKPTLSCSPQQSSTNALPTQLQPASTAYRARKEVVTHTPTPKPLHLAGARGQHRCAPGYVGRLAQAHTGSKRQSDIMW